MRFALCILNRDVKKKLTTSKSCEETSEAQQGCMCTFWRGHFKFFLAHASLPHILIILTEPALSCKSEADPQGHSKTGRDILPKILKFSEYLALFQWGFGDNGMDRTKLLWTTKLSLGCTWKLPSSLLGLTVSTVLNTASAPGQPVSWLVARQVFPVT